MNIRINKVAKPKQIPAMHMHSEGGALDSNKENETQIAYDQHFIVEHQNVINFADNEFGAKCWSHSITHQAIDFVDFSDGKYSVGVAAFVKVVQLNSGVFHEELGYGICHGLGSKSLSISSARKEAAINALKNAIQSFGGIAINGMRLETPSKVIETSPVINLPHTEIQSGIHKRSHSPDGMVLPVVQNKAALPKSSKIASSFDSAKLHTPGQDTNELQDEEERKLERKRRQRQKQEEFKQHFKSKSSSNSPQFNLNPQNKPPNEWIKVDEMIQTLDDAGAAFISTQELDNMVQVASVSYKSTGPQYRLPLLSSPPKRNAVHEWRVGNNNAPRRLEMNK